MTKPHIHREPWLMAAVEALTPIFADRGYKVPHGIRVSVGFPGGRGRKAGVIGQCWNSHSATDKCHQIFIHPKLIDREEILGVLIHEIAHAIDDCESGHKGKFVEIIRAVGLTGKPTEAIEPSEALSEELEPIIAELGPYPHAALGVSDDEDSEGEGEKKQSTRMLKLECDCCGYIVRTTRKWLEIGNPSCPHGTEMEEAA